MRCTSNDYCCPGTVCDWDGGSSYGRCVFVRGRRLGEPCRRDADCESGFICSPTEGGSGSVCSVPLSMPKQYNEECETSTDCDVSRGLCCQLQRRHRQTHRKVRAEVTFRICSACGALSFSSHNLDLHFSDATLTMFSAPRRVHTSTVRWFALETSQRTRCATIRE